ncbi:MAG: protease modulator HflC, partial [Alphaproteobacteria bacterium]|nr:protease modulator HflC [Alphaproteobacteria bacterium]
EKEKAVIIAEAEKKAQIIRGQGDQEAVAIWNNAAGTDPKFFAFYRSLEAYNKSLTNKEDTSMVLAPDSEFFEFFNKTGK